MRGRLKQVLLGKARSPTDRAVFQHLSLAAFFAWVGLGTDGLSSSCYGPQEGFLALHGHIYLGLFVSIGTALTVLVISYSYSQIVELFPTGGGGYLVASKLLSPRLGMVSGCALLIDYVLTVAVSVASGADALFSFLPPAWHAYKLHVALAGVVVLTGMNLRGVRESVLPLVPIFVIFLVTHVAAILYAVLVRVPDMGSVVQETASDISLARSELGLLGMLIVIVRAYSMGAGTFTGIEAVSNGLPVLREPRVQTAKRTMAYMAVSLAFTAGGLMVAYCLHRVAPTASKTANAALLETLTAGWGGAGHIVVLVTLVSEAAILFVAAQTGFIDGPRVLANMAMDRWLPGRFTNLSDRLVTAYGIVIMGLTAFVMVLLTRGSVGFLVVLYSINVFITFVLSQTGMVRHWWMVRHQVGDWLKKLLINGVGLGLSALILVSMVCLKFHEGGWITLLVTGGLVAVALAIRRHYDGVSVVLRRLDGLVTQARQEMSKGVSVEPKPVPGGSTGVLLVNGFNGLGLHSLLNMIRLFGKSVDNYVFIQVGVVDAGSFKGVEEVDALQKHVAEGLSLYKQYMHAHGLPAETYSAVGVDLVEEISALADQVDAKHPGAVYFGGQLVFTKDSLFNRLLHNNIIFTVQRRFYLKGVPFVVLPVRV